jgi:hypothetical protein
MMKDIMKKLAKKVGPYGAEALYNMNVKKGKWHREEKYAMAKLENEIQKNPNNAQVYSDLGQCYINLKNKMKKRSLKNSTEDWRLFYAFE